jgi:hypothetical protein
MRLEYRRIGHVLGGISAGVEKLCALGEVARRRGGHLGLVGIGGWIRGTGIALGRIATRRVIAAEVTGHAEGLSRAVHVAHAADALRTELGGRQGLDHLPSGRRALVAHAVAGPILDRLAELLAAAQRAGAFGVAGRGGDGARVVGSQADLAAGEQLTRLGIAAAPLALRVALVAATAGAAVGAAGHALGGVRVAQPGRLAVARVHAGRFSLPCQIGTDRPARALGRVAGAKRQHLVDAQRGAAVVAGGRAAEAEGVLEAALRVRAVRIRIRVRRWLHEAAPRVAAVVLAGVVALAAELDALAVGAVAAGPDPEGEREALPVDAARPLLDEQQVGALAFG